MLRFFLASGLTTAYTTTVAKISIFLGHQKQPYLEEIQKAVLEITGKMGASLYNLHHCKLREMKLAHCRSKTIRQMCFCLIKTSSGLPVAD